MKGFNYSPNILKIASRLFWPLIYSEETCFPYSITAPIDLNACALKTPEKFWICLNSVYIFYVNRDIFSVIIYCHFHRKQLLCLPDLSWANVLQPIWTDLPASAKPIYLNPPSQGPIKNIYTCKRLKLCCCVICNINTIIARANFWVLQTGFMENSKRFHILWR